MIDMFDYTEPTSWMPPCWHPDYGNVQAELDHLRNAAQCVIEQLPQLSVGLCMPEAGVMFLVITNRREEMLAEIYSIELDKGNHQRQYGVFLNPNSIVENEQYTSSTQRVVELLRFLVT